MKDTTVHSTRRKGVRRVDPNICIEDGMGTAVQTTNRREDKMPLLRKQWLALGAICGIGLMVAKDLYMQKEKTVS